MSDVEITEPFLMEIAGWAAMKKAREYADTGRVLGVTWEPPVLKGTVQAAGGSVRCGLVIRSKRNIENLCRCRESQQFGTLCAHSIALGVLHARANNPQATQAKNAPKPPPQPQSHPTPEVSRRAKRIRRDPDGACLMIYWILPPRLEEALDRGRILLCLEGESRGRRAPLDRFVDDREYLIRERDHQALKRIEQISGDTPAAVQLSPQQLASLLPDWTGQERISLGKARQIQVLEASGEGSCRLELSVDDLGRLQILSEGVSGGRLLKSEDGTAFLYQNGVFRPAGAGAAFQGQTLIPRHEVPDFLLRRWKDLAATPGFRSSVKPEDFEILPMPPRVLLQIDGGMAILQARLQCAYGSRVITPGVSSPEEDAWIPDPQHPMRYHVRDQAAENRAMQTLRNAGFSAPDTGGVMNLRGEDRVLAFLTGLLPKLQKTWEVTTETRLSRSLKQNVERIEPSMRIVASGEDWFELSLDFRTSSGESYSPSEIQQLLLSSGGRTRGRGAKWAVLDTEMAGELQATLADCGIRQKDGRLQVSRSQSGYLQETLGSLGLSIGGDSHSLQAWQGAAGKVEWALPEIGGLKDVLRPYQKQGVSWLAFLRENGFGGILADEMGLGKTLQTLALIEGCVPRVDAGSSSGLRGSGVLVVCPSSLVFNWVAEARKFVPHRKVLAIEGSRRGKLLDALQEADIVVTSYALMRRDEEHYRGHHFDTVVLDEAQHIKNRQTQNAKSVKRIRADHRLVLTGTPVENSVQDLWSIFDFLMPGYLGSAEDFRERYEAPLGRGAAVDPEIRKRLARRLRPFVLRRLKREVAADLPDRIDQVSYCDLNSSQAQLYKDVLEAGRREAFDAHGRSEAGKQRMMVLTALTRLRQICCDPRLLGDSIRPGRQPAGKVALFLELLDEVLDGDHRVLVFSQFTSMLRLLETALEERGVEYCSLDGSTRNRSEVVERFQTGKIPVFLISLKAGGTGLNLTAADTVIHFDPWWNPAVEAQASDRAHRIGQTRVVTTYKLIARNTVEEKILKLQESKRELFSQMVEGEEQAVDRLTWEEIQDLLT